MVNEVVNVSCRKSAALNFTHDVAVQFKHSQSPPNREAVPRMPRLARLLVELPFNRAGMVSAVSRTER